MPTNKASIASLLRLLWPHCDCLNCVWHSVVVYVYRWKLEPNVCDCLTTPIQILTPDFNWPAGPSVTHYKEGEVLALDVFVFNLWTSAHEKKFQWNKKHTHTHLYSVSAVWQRAISDVVWCNCFISLLIDVVWCIYSLMNVLEFGCAGKRWPVMVPWTSTCLRKLSLICFVNQVRSLCL